MQVMVASYSVDGDAFLSQKPTLWSKGEFLPRHEGWDVALHSDGNRIAAAAADTQGTTKQDKILIVFNFFNELRRLVPKTTR